MVRLLLARPLARIIAACSLVLVPGVVAGALFIRGDVDANRSQEITDPINILGFLFLGDPEKLSCMDAADVDDDGRIDITDPIYLLEFLMLGGPPPPPPQWACGEDPTPDNLGCESHPICEPPNDIEPPVILGQACTKIACRDPLRLEIGKPIDVVAIDGCNACTPPRFEDKGGLTFIRIGLLDGSGRLHWSIDLRVMPPASLLALDNDAVLVLDDSADPFDPPVLRRIPYTAVLPPRLTPGEYTRRITATDAVGYKVDFDVPVVVVPAGGSGPIEVVEGTGERDLFPDATPEEIAAAVAGNAEFALDLYRRIRGEGGNIFFSPYSISFALAMTHAGARAETERQIAATLRFPQPQERLHAALNALDLDLARRAEAAGDGEGDPFRLEVANSIWGQRGYDFLPGFLDVLSLNYGAGLRLLDFQADPESSRLVINDWVSDRTNDRIKDLLPPGVITTLTRLVLTNAIYFKASWMVPFPEASTRDGSFTALGGGRVTVPMMSLDAALGYSSGEAHQVVELPYTGDELAMTILLPDAGRYEEFEASLDAGRLGAILAGIGRTRIQLRMPRFRYEFVLPLKATLAAMGMPDAFSETTADFSGMDGRRGLFIHDVRHKAFIAVNEAGTEAAAATAVVIGPTSIPPEVAIDRPFIFLIRDRATGALLFLGRVLDPAG